MSGVYQSSVDDFLTMESLSIPVHGPLAQKKMVCHEENNEQIN
jgi:hypothetical protein